MPARFAHRHAQLGAYILSALLLGAAFASPADAQFTQKGSKLTPTGGSSSFGYSLSLSTDGATLLVGAPGDNGNVGAGFPFKRVQGAWVSLGKLTPQSASRTGSSVALSADGTTAILGGPTDDSNNGKARVYTRSGDTWSLQQTLQGTGIIGSAAQGTAVAISSDGNTVAIGGHTDNVNVGAVWIFTRSGGVWTQQGGKLVGSGVVGGTARMGASVALSSDGNTVMFGGPADNSGAGATWVFTRSGGVWSQLGSKLVGTGGTPSANQGYTVAISGDSNTALIGGAVDGTAGGAVWVFIRSGNTWTQQGNKLTASDGSNPSFGSAVALSVDGNTAIIGGPNDSSGVQFIGATWIFKRLGTTWSQSGNKLVGTGSVLTPSCPIGIFSCVFQGSAVALSGDASVGVSGGPGDGGSSQGAVWTFTQPVLALTPTTPIVANGPVGGPFAPASFDFTLGAPGSDVSYTITGVPDWLTPTSASGTIAADASKVVTFSTNNAANAKAVGTYGPAPITFTGTNGVFAVNATLNVAANGPVTALSAVLPASRSVQVGTTATAFATLINTSSTAGTACGLSLGGSVPAAFKFATTNPATNAVNGALNATVGIPANGSQSFAFAITPSAAFNATDIPITAGCSNGTPAPVVVGLNTLLMSASAAPVPDIVALAASVDPGYVNLPGNTGTGAFSVATVNVGASASIIVQADTGSATLPVTITLCQTNAQAQCTNPATPAASVGVTINANDTPTFSIFVKGSGAVANNPAVNRVFVRFKDTGGATRGATSVAVKTQ